MKLLRVGPVGGERPAVPDAAGRPLWQLLGEADPAWLVSQADFRYLGDALTPQQALDPLALAAGDGPVAGVVGWADLTDPAVADRLAELRALPRRTGRGDGRHRATGVRAGAVNPRTGPPVGV